MCQIGGTIQYINVHERIKSIVVKKIAQTKYHSLKYGGFIEKLKKKINNLIACDIWM